MELIKKIDKKFSFDNKELRVLGTCEEPWFVAKDICDVLQIKDVSMALKKIQEKWKGTKIIGTLGGNQDMRIINESAVYKLIMRSNKPIAEKFQEFVCEEILPSIRKTGEFKLKELMEKHQTELTEKEEQILLTEKELQTSKKENKDLHRLVKRKERKKFKRGHNVYIISNPSIPDYYKVGKTHDINSRLVGVGGGAPLYFQVEHCRYVANDYESTAIESLILSIFENYRVENENKGSKKREWLEGVKFEIIKKELDMLVDYLENRKKNYNSSGIEVREENDESEIDDVEDYTIETDNETEIPVTKQCYDCKIDKVLDDYYDRIDNQDGKEGTCKICYSKNKQILKAEKHEREIIKRKENTKKCRQCNIIKSFDSFDQHGTSKDGYEYCCKECKENKNNKVTEQKCAKCKVVKNIDKFEKYRLSHRKICIECNTENVNNTETNKKTCSSCKNELDLSKFSKSKSSIDGYYNYCSDCGSKKCKEYKEKKKQEAKITPKEKTCADCKKTKETIENFYKSNTSKDGYKNRCKECQKEFDKKLYTSKTT